ncbi:hypothetical protein DY000_02037002 [Brassica cretica]|uniref:Uncharacterized protein n=1 Tax=Brassica cretica TaxID=69181 RepID=A0ABQ7BQA6_BRACR|nr:hypothetical protein DY000_02037002 [Brassica cretica]
MMKLNESEFMVPTVSGVPVKRRLVYRWSLKAVKERRSCDVCPSLAEASTRVPSSRRVVRRLFCF